MEFLVFLGLLVTGFVFGQIAERRHFSSIRRREAELADVLAFSVHLPPITERGRDAVLVGGNVVISVDYFKNIAAGLRSFLGGRVSAYESLLERARREAILRMKEDARRRGGNVIFNVKLSTSSISQSAANQIGCVEVYAYGTAMVPRGSTRSA